MRSRLLLPFLAAAVLTSGLTRLSGLTFFGRSSQSSGAVEAFLEDLRALGAAGQEAQLIFSFATHVIDM